MGNIQGTTSQAYCMALYQQSESFTTALNLVVPPNAEESIG
jgi:hypothetical protein